MIFSFLEVFAYLLSSCLCVVWVWVLVYWLALLFHYFDFRMFHFSWFYISECCSTKGGWGESDPWWYWPQQFRQVGFLLLIWNWTIIFYFLLSVHLLLYDFLWWIFSVVVKADKKLLTVLFPDGRDGRAFTLKVPL